MKKKSVFLLALMIGVTCFQHNILASQESSETNHTNAASEDNTTTFNNHLNEVQIGYQSYKVSDFVIKETFAGMLQKEKQVRISISDYISRDMTFHPDFEIEIIGDLKIKNQGVSYLVGDAAGYLNNQENNDSYIYFDIERASTEPSTIKLTNLHVKIDRTVPVSTIPYDLVVWGSAIAENYGENQDQFKRAGIRIPYAIVVDPQTGNKHLDVYKPISSSS